MVRQNDIDLLADVGKLGVVGSVEHRCRNELANLVELVLGNAARRARSSARRRSRGWRWRFPGSSARRTRPVAPPASPRPAPP